MTYLNGDPREIPLIEIDPAAAGVADGAALVTPNERMANALQVPLIPYYKNKSLLGEKDELDEIYSYSIESLDEDKRYHSKSPLHSMVTSWVIDNQLRIRATSYAKGYAQGLVQFLSEHGYDHSEQLRQDSLLFEGYGALQGFAKGLAWKKDPQGLELSDPLTDSLQRESIALGVVASILKEYGISIDSALAPRTSRGLELMRSGSKGELYTPNNQESESADAFNLFNNHKLGLRIWLAEMGVDDIVDVDRIFGKNLTAFRFGLKGMDVNDPLVQSAIGNDFLFFGATLASESFDLDRFTRPLPKKSSFEIELDEILGEDLAERDPYALYKLPGDEFYHSPQDLQINNPNKTISGKSIRENRISPYYNVNAYTDPYDGKTDSRTVRSTSFGYFAPTPVGTSKQAYELGLAAKSQIDAKEKNSGTDHPQD